MEKQFSVCSPICSRHFDVINLQRFHNREWRLAWQDVLLGWQNGDDAQGELFSLDDLREDKLKPVIISRER